LTPVTVYYANTGGTDIPAPLLGFSTDTAMVRLASDSIFLGNSVAFLGIDPSGPAGVLPPGASGSVNLVVETTDVNADSVTISAGAVDPGQAVNWSDLATNERPSYASASAWTTIVNNLAASIGGTAGDLQSALDADATYLSGLGERTSDINSLLGLEFLNADAALPSAASAPRPTPPFPLQGRFRWT
jgi:hypothetical protein